MTTPFTIEPLVIPEAPGAPGWADFEAANEVRNVCEEFVYGTSDLRRRAEELLPHWTNTEFEPRQGLVAKRDGIVVGRAVVDTLADPASAHAWLEVLVRPEARGQGIGAALGDAIEQLAISDGRSTFIVYAASPDAPGARLDAPTGFGSVPLENHEVRFLLDRGYRLEQLNRGSRLELPADERAMLRLETDANARSAPDYRAISWTGPTPAGFQSDLAHLHTRMSTDAPTAGLEEPEDVWTVERVVTEEASRASTGTVAVTAAAEHVPSGRLVAFSTLLVPSEADRAIGQDDTLVLREHRGHRLGALVKLANIRAVQRDFPERPSIITFNAEENRPMLDVNEALGFVPIGYEGAWRRDVSTSGR